MSMQQLALVFGAIVFEVLGDNMLKLSDGMRRKAPLIGVAIGYGMSFYILSGVMASAPLGLVYATWTGAGIALTAVVSAIVWKERFTPSKVAGIALIAAGVALLELGV